MQQLLERLAIRPKDPDLFVQALTHKSFSKTNNERLEFMGDALLDLVIAHHLYRQFPDLPEGKLSQLRALLVKGESLAECAREIELSRCIRLGQGEIKSGGAERPSILADAFEALFGAIYLDQGFDKASAVAAELFASRLENLSGQSLKDAKTRLQELMQSRQMGLPLYQLVSSSGKHHQQVFRISCTLEGLAYKVEASGTSKKQAEQQAAAEMLALIQSQEPVK